MNEAFRVLHPCSAQRAFTILEDVPGAGVMDIVGGEHRDPAMAVHGVSTMLAERGS